MRAAPKDPTSPDAATEAVWRYRGDVWRLARRLCRHRQDAEDVTQSALLKAVQRLDGFQWEASLRTWLHTIATNECRMLRRRPPPLSLDKLLADVAAVDQRYANQLVTGSEPEEAAVEADLRRQVIAALAGLSDRYRTAVSLADGLGLPAREVATAMGLTVPATRAVLHRARSVLRERLAPMTLP